MMPVWLPGLAVALLLGVAASAYFWLVRRRRDEQIAGLQTLSAMRWREFAHLILDAMARRGLTVAHPAAAESQDPKTSFLLHQGDQSWMLFCKHGSAYRIGSSTVEELATHVRLGGASGGILVTDGIVQKSGRESALQQRMELLDGGRLWHEVRPIMRADDLEHIHAGARARALRHTAIAWLASVTAGLLVIVSLAQVDQEPVPATLPNASASPVATPADAGTVQEPASGLAEPSEEELERLRAEALKGVKQVAGIARASWLTKQTLSVDLLEPEQAVWPRICQQLELYPLISNTRIQLNPPLDSSDPVRWRQCKTL